MSSRPIHPPTSIPPLPEYIPPGHCQNCSHDLNALAVGSACPACGHPIQGLCRGCGYDLAGLAVSGVCPECSKPVADSLRGDLLAFAGSEYIAKLHTGVWYILAAIILMVCMAILGFVVAMVIGVGAGAPGSAHQFLEWGSLAGSLVGTGLSIYGWYLFSTPDPAGHLLDPGDRPRRIVRIAVLVTAAITLISTVIQFLEPAAARNPWVGRGNTPAGFMAVLAIVLMIAGFIVWIVQFFAAMRYLQWLAPRIPDTKLAKRARTYVWLLPVIYVPGALACGLGILVALVMYYNFLDAFRKALKRIAAAQVSA